MFTQELQQAYRMLLVKNPCKKCIVRPCCTSICKAKEHQRDISSPFGFIEGKVIAMLFLSTFSMAIISGICLVIKLTI
jgi:hypothetical protein